MLATSKSLGIRNAVRNRIDTRTDAPLFNITNWFRRGAASIVGAAIAFAAAMPLASSANAQSFPTRPVRIIVPYGAGGIADVTMRMVAEKLSAKLGQQFVIDNRPGAAGIVGLKAVMASPPDGYTLAMIGGGLTAAKALFKSLPYDLETDFIPISTTASYGIVVATKAGSPLKSIKDVIATAKSNPGKLNFGSINPGSNQHLSGELFKSLAGISATTIPFKTTPELLTAAIRGDVDIIFEYQAALQGPLSDGQIVAIATTGREAAPSLPGVPTVAESGLPGYEITSWNALAAPTGTPMDIVNILNKGVNEVLTIPEVKAAAAKFGMEARGSTVEDLRERIKLEVVKWAKAAEAAGLEKK
jgi:tripartite-type tricarboxylate transporter receptor subunit TctC